MDLKHVDPKRIVADGYDRIAEQYYAWARHVRQEERAKYTSLLLEKLPVGAAVLDLGCGGCPPTTRQLAEHFAVTGVDISARQVALARHNVPMATFLRADMTQLDFAPASFDAVAAFYSLRQPSSREVTWREKCALGSLYAILLMSLSHLV